MCAFTVGGRCFFFGGGGAFTQPAFKIPKVTRRMTDTTKCHASEAEVMRRHPQARRQLLHACVDKECDCLNEDGGRCDAGVGSFGGGGLYQ